MAKRYYRPELDALRFFAFVCVFLNHQHFGQPFLQHIAETGEFGMCIFFMLSAYLIVTILLIEKEQTGTVSWKGFALRRILRIWPLYFAVMFLIFGLGHFWPAAHLPGHAVLAFSLLVGNIYILRHGWTVGPLSPLWSISVEEQFYLVVPMLARFTSRRGMARICFATIGLAYVVLLWIGHQDAIPAEGVWVNSFVQFQFFAAGGLIALWLHDRDFNLSTLLRSCLALAGLGTWYVTMLVFHLQAWTPSHPSQLFVGYLLVLLATAMIFLSVLGTKSHIPRPLVYLGKISYGLYLFHDLFVQFIFRSSDIFPKMAYFQHHNLIAIPIAFVLTVTTAALSYHFFERPILKFKERFETIKTRPA